MTVDMERIEQSEFLKNWKVDVINFAKVLAPDIPIDVLNRRLNKKIKKCIKNKPVKLQNSYTKEEDKPSTVLSVLDWIEKKKPITSEHGVLFKQHDEEMNPNADTLEDLGNQRKYYKKLMLKYGEEEGLGSDNCKLYNMLQLDTKISMNAFYGASGLETSQFFNLFIALSITGKGQAIISSSMTAFERFLADNVPYLSLDDAITSIMIILKEEVKIDIFEVIDTKITLEQCRERVFRAFYDISSISQDDVNKLDNFLTKLTEEELARVYYKNNLFEFCSNSEIQSLLITIMDKLGNIPQEQYKYINDKGKWDYKIKSEEHKWGEYIIFMDPNEIPKAVDSEMKRLWSLIETFVVDYSQTFDRINKLKHYQRKAVITIDTDSNFLDLNPWFEFVDKSIGERQESYYLNEDETRFNIINIMSCICTLMINESLFRFVKDCNVKDDSKARLINMKNEYLFSRVMLTDAKKNYASIIELKEGALISPSEMDIKGLPIAKSTLNDKTQDTLQDILENNILRPKKIDVGLIISRLNELENNVRSSLVNGELEYLKPLNVKDMSAYKNPLSEIGIIGVMVWNIVYPEQQIQLPESILLVKVKMEKLENIAELANTDRETFDRLVKGIYNNSKLPELANKGIPWIAIPSDVTKIPDWIIPYIDYETIVNTNIKNFSNILSSLDVVELSSVESNTSYSNILKI